jgi:hypothetical protein
MNEPINTIDRSTRTTARHNCYHDDEGIAWYYTDAECATMDHMVDTQRDTTLDGQRRCDKRYKGADLYCDIVWRRCTQPATASVQVTENGETFVVQLCDDCASVYQTQLRCGEVQDISL